MKDMLLSDIMEIVEYSILTHNSDKKTASTALIFCLKNKNKENSVSPGHYGRAIISCI